jgi:hypothetical protein
MNIDQDPGFLNCFIYVNYTKLTKVMKKERLPILMEYFIFGLPLTRKNSINHSSQFLDYSGSLRLIHKDL